MFSKSNQATFIMPEGICFYGNITDKLIELFHIILANYISLTDLNTLSKNLDRQV